MNKLQILKSAKEVLILESKAINDLAKSLNDDFFKAVKSIEGLKGKLIISGVGKSGNIASKIAASFTSTGIPSVFLNPVDASHGDMGIVRAEDILIVLSNSGESHELSDLLDFAKRHSVKIISICSNNKSLLAKNSDINLKNAKVMRASVDVRDARHHHLLPSIFDDFQAVLASLGARKLLHRVQCAHNTVRPVREF